ncbi:plasmid pRiA4b ORF-3 family protein [Gordonia alkaliphila]|uniref:plasmid pRiA4b ORF-3 family protein n=1 Tax=Gordonia alkaliphila TaxID=1053547 RepID=UPI001FF34584|nr:plasmid pRiA4b ORF-3 family protein [Gordonia alkaliphila]MCK0440906.1 plasmid pRiA4b ORF-3 family protein [Gordonia alkaliphila]
MASMITLHIQLEEIEPPIVRELQVNGDLSMADLHTAIQLAFGWREQHLHLFVDAQDPRRATRHWGDPYQLDELDPTGFRPEAEVSIAAAVDGGPIWYEYDFGDGWTHRITASAQTTAIGDLRPVTLVGGQRRGPVEDSGGAWGYTEKLAILADPDHPEHAEIAEWVAAVTGPWFPPTPETFDVASIQAELDDYFGYRADERDPLDLSGLLVADDLRGPDDLAPDALLADFASGLPAGIRSEFRQYVRRTGLLDPVDVSPEVRRQLVAPFAWLLDAVGPDGLTLTKAGWLPPAVVLDGMTTLGWHDSRIGSSTREESTPPIRDLRDAATRLGLVRKLRGRLVRTGHGHRAATGTDALWDALTSRILHTLSPGAQVAGAALLTTYADGRATPNTWADERWRDVAYALDVCGWEPRGEGDDRFDRRSIGDITLPVKFVLNSLGSTVGATGWPPPRALDPHLADFARAVLHGPAGIRSGSTSPYR